MNQRDKERRKRCLFKHTGNLTIEQIKTIAKTIQNKSLSRVVKEVLGTCVSVGITLDEKSPKDVQKEVYEGKVKI